VHTSVRVPGTVHNFFTNYLRLLQLWSGMIEGMNSARESWLPLILLTLFAMVMLLRVKFPKRLQNVGDSGSGDHHGRILHGLQFSSSEPAPLGPGSCAVPADQRSACYP
jgi:hypothetical protein